MDSTKIAPPRTVGFWGTSLFPLNGMIGADENFLTAESYFAEACGGVIRQPEGGIEGEPGAPQAVVAEISDADILNLEEVEYSAFRGDADSEWINTVAPRYVEPAQRYKMLSAPHRRDNADVIADGGPRPDAPRPLEGPGCGARRLSPVGGLFPERGFFPRGAAGRGCAAGDRGG